MPPGQNGQRDAIRERMRQTIVEVPEEGNVTPPKKSKKDQKEPATESKVTPPKKCKKDTKDKKRLSEEPNVTESNVKDPKVNHS